MRYELSIRQHNLRPHLDIERDIESKRNGQFTFILRVNNGNIVDYVVMEYRDARHYLQLKKIVIEKYTITRADRIGSGTDPIRTDNIQRESGKRSGGFNNNNGDEEQTQEV